MNNMYYQNSYAEFDSLYHTTEAAKVTENLPEGDYIAQINTASFETETNETPATIKLELVVVSETLNGAITVFKSSIRRDRQTGKLIQTSMAFFKKDLKTLNIEINSFSELDLALQSVVGKDVKISVRKSSQVNRNGEHYTNIYINELVNYKDRQPQSSAPSSQPVQPQSSSPQPSAPNPQDQAFDNPNSYQHPYDYYNNHPF